MGVRWPWKEWKPNMAEVEFSVVFDKTKTKPRVISLQEMDFQHVITPLPDALGYVWQGNCQNRDKLFQNTMTL